MIPGLDGLRAVAFLLVLGAHTDNLSFGWVGLQLFFVLSGFLITGILIRMKNSLGKREYFTKFYGRRFLRIVPLYYFYIFLMFGLKFAAPVLEFKPLLNEFGDKFWLQVWLSIFYVYDFFHTTSAYEHSRFFTHLWSLSVEEQFYILWPLIVFLTPNEKMKRLFFGAIALGPIMRGVVYWVYSYHRLPFMTTIPDIAVYAMPFSHIDAFAFGAFASQFEIPRPRLQLFLASILVPAIGLSTQYLVEGRALWSTLGQGFLFSVGYMQIWGYSLLNYLFMVLIYNVAKTGLFNHTLDLPPLRYLGKISYGLYVYHTAAIWLVLKLGSIDSGNMVLYGISFVVTAVVASLSYQVFEKPINDLKDKYFPLSVST